MSYHCNVHCQTWRQPKEPRSQDWNLPRTGTLATLHGDPVPALTCAVAPLLIYRAGDKSRKAIPNWTPLLGTPAHPEFPSGHQATVGGFLAVLQAAVGDKVTFKVGSEGLPKVTRTYKSLSAAALEVGDSR